VGESERERERNREEMRESICVCEREEVKRRGAGWGGRNGLWVRERESREYVREV